MYRHYAGLNQAGLKLIYVSVNVLFKRAVRIRSVVLSGDTAGLLGDAAPISVGRRHKKGA